MNEAMRTSALSYHARYHGKIEMHPKIPWRGWEDLPLAYTPGVAEPCRAIWEQPDEAFTYTNRGNTVAIISDGSAVLGLGDIGPLAALPVLEGKAVLFKVLAGIDAVPICIQERQAESLVRAVAALEPSFAAINLEDIAAPRAFEVAEALADAMSVPVFHDDQHGTAVVVAAALHNALRLTGKSEPSIVINGAGAAGLATTRLLLAMGWHRITVVDTAGIVYRGRKENMNRYKAAIAELTNLDHRIGDLRHALAGADVFIGLSTRGILTADDVALMNRDPIVFALANPEPEILPDLARRAGAAVVGTGRSDFPNQINNALAFPGIFRGLLETRARRVTERILIGAAQALAQLVTPNELSETCIVPRLDDPRVAPAVAAGVTREVVAQGLAQRSVTPQEVYQRCQQLAAPFRPTPPSGQGA